jgi:GMP synthase (glutamine-hydrolysing)
VCFGHQAIAAALGGPQAVRRAPRGELGWETIRIDRPNPIVRGLPTEFTCFASHFDEVSPGGEGVEVFASSERCPVQAVQVEGRPIWSMQFHPEMDPDESEALVRSNLARHESLGDDPEEVLSTRVDSRHLGEVIFANFLELAAPLL